MKNELFHYGTPHAGSTPHSGRYPWDPSQHLDEHISFLDRCKLYKKEGKSEAEIAKAMNLSINDFRKAKSIAAAEVKADQIARARKLREHGWSYDSIGKMVAIDKDNPIGESTIRGWLKTTEESRKDKIETVADLLESKIKNGKMLDVGEGTYLDLGITKTTFDTALKLLKDKGYEVDTIRVEQANVPGKYTTVKYLAEPGTTKADAWNNRENIGLITEYSPDGGKTILETQYPSSISLDRVKIMYAEEGGELRDGMVGIRRGVEDLSLGNSSYAQVRIAVDDKYYIKGMAIYDDSVPKGYDVVVYSNKSMEQGYEKALKKLKDDSENPFGANIKTGAGGQNYYKAEDGKYVKQGENYVLDESKKLDGERYNLGAINKIREEGDWDAYRRILPAQVLSKQPLELINRQLKLTYSEKAEEYDEISKLTNPIVKRKLLNDFAEGIDKTARHLDAAALPRQNSRVIIPVPELGDNEIYAPTYSNGEKLALIRYPHAGIFEIPILVVNNNNPAAKKLLGNAADAVGINKNVADRLSGADFDGDHVVAIPISDKVRINSKPPLKGLIGFDPKKEYAGYEGMRRMTARETGIQMGIVTNLITDMSIQHAPDDEITRAAKHSMVVIDAEKHGLDWKRSERENGIEALKMRYQKNPSTEKGYGGSSTLLSRLGNATVKVDELQIVDRNGKKSYKADPETGEWLYGETGRTYSKLKRDSKGNVKLDDEGKPIYEIKKYKSEVSPLQLVKDANELSSGHPVETAYATHINKMRALANKARKDALSIPTPAKDPTAAKVYENEVNSLNANLNIALKNAPRERQAQLKANVKIEAVKASDPSLAEDKDKLKKTRQRILTESRIRSGARKQSIYITDREWEAIQSNAISGTKLSTILDNSDMDRVRKLATPKKQKTISQYKINRIKALSNSGFTVEEIAKAAEVSTSTVSKYLKADVSTLSNI